MIAGDANPALQTLMTEMPPLGSLTVELLQKGNVPPQSSSKSQGFVQIWLGAVPETTRHLHSPSASGG